MLFNMIASFQRIELINSQKDIVRINTSNNPKSLDVIFSLGGIKTIMDQYKRGLSLEVDTYSELVTIKYAATPSHSLCLSKQSRVYAT